MKFLPLNIINVDPIIIRVVDTGQVLAINALASLSR